MDQIQPFLPIAVPLLALAASYGALNSRLSTLERHIEQTVSRAEFQALKDQLSDVVSELRGLRKDLIDLIRER